MNQPARRLHTAVALAACSFQLQADAVGDDRIISIQLTPAGHFKPSDGRKMDVPAWYIDASVAARVIERFNARVNPAVVDYEHQTLHKETNGQPAPAAAWMRALQWREGSGLWATTELTPQAAEQIRTGAYRYVSPVFLYDKTTGEVLAMQMAAFTNDPAIDGMQAMELRAAACFAHDIDPDKETSMNPLLKAFLAALGLPETTSEADAIAACSSLTTSLGVLRRLQAELGAEGEPAVAACSALKTQATATPDPTKFVPIAALEEVRGQVAALSAERTADKVSALVEDGLADGRLLPSMKDWATDLGKKDLAALSSFLDKAGPIAALTSTQTGGRKPAGATNEHGLDAAEMAVCSATGVTPEAFAKSKKDTAQAQA
ncbi:phage protease [Stenotrophomonas sp. GD03819]|uniref:phage protease n=1 Tax=Stenotrophomonas TaxID=40323 RepID=UPI00244CECAC|nr:MULTISPECIES: phage protease [Stenotrophomonas]MDH1792896.1 phage protease [Stenotrophomonas sp. GD03819]WNF12516.1 phage protease [Stenotrophomonas geniculata]